MPHDFPLMVVHFVKLVVVVQVCVARPRFTLKVVAVTILSSAAAAEATSLLKIPFCQPQFATSRTYS